MALICQHLVPPRILKWGYYFICSATNRTAVQPYYSLWFHWTFNLQCYLFWVGLLMSNWCSSFPFFRQAEVLKADMTGIGWLLCFYSLFYGIKLREGHHLSYIACSTVLVAKRDENLLFIFNVYCFCTVNSYLRWPVKTLYNLYYIELSITSFMHIII